MFNFLFKKKTNLNLTDKEIQNFLVILSNLSAILIESGNDGQARVTQRLSNLLNERNIKEFVEIINSVDMFGGAGAVWEVYIFDKPLSRNFATEMIKLINLMEETNILGRGIKPIRKTFIKDLQS